MAVINVAFEVPKAIAKGLASGKYVRMGGVIRDAKNMEIVMHLKEAGDVAKVDGAAVGGNALFFVGLAAGVAIGVGAATLYNKHKNDSKKRKRKEREREIADVMNLFNDSFEKYMDSLKNERINQIDIDNMMYALSRLDSLKSDNVIVQANADMMRIMLESIRDYTHRFADANNCLFLESKDTEGNEIADFRKYLKMQEHVLEKVS